LVVPAVAEEEGSMKSRLIDLKLNLSTGLEEQETMRRGGNRGEEMRRK
jgi:hypothetical protein